MLFKAVVVVVLSHPLTPGAVGTAVPELGLVAVPRCTHTMSILIKSLGWLNAEGFSVAVGEYSYTIFAMGR